MSIIREFLLYCIQFKAAQEMFELKGKEMNMLADIQGGRATHRNLSSKQNKLDEETLKQQEILYTQVLSILLSFDFCLAVV